MSDHLVEVRLLGVPLAEQIAASEHFDDLTREFRHMQFSDPTGQSVPARLVVLREALMSRFGAFTALPAQVRGDAIARGEATVDLIYHLPPEAADAVRELGDLLDEAEEFCRSGAHLLTVVTPPSALRFRRWYLAEFINQLAGGAPTPWADDSTNP